MFRLATQDKDVTKPIKHIHQVIASGLRNPRGFTWGCDGALYVAESGLPGAEPTNFTGRVSRVKHGIRETIVDNLPVSVGAGGDTVGASDVAFIGKRLYVSISAGPAHGHPDFPGGVYRVKKGSIKLVANTDKFNVANPPLDCADCGTPADELSNTFSMIAHNCKLYLVDANKDVINVVDPNASSLGRIARFADFSPLQVPTGTRQFVTTAITVGADGAFYVTNLTSFPFLPAQSKIFRVDQAGRISIVYEGLTLGVGITTSPCNRTFVTEFGQSTGGLPPFFAPPGRVVEVLEDGTINVIADNLIFPSLGRWTPIGLLVSNFSSFDATGNGEILLVLKAEK
jgi:hypothetical protein